MTDEPKPLSAEELQELESRAGVTGLSTVDVRRLLANNARLRQLVMDAARLLTPNSPITGEKAREVYEEIKNEVKR